MNSFTKRLVDMAFGYYELGIAQEKKMCKEFERRAEEAETKYWDACKYPRKTKKKIRKEAQQEYSFYKQLAKPVLFSW